MYCSQSVGLRRQAVRRTVLRASPHSMRSRSAGTLGTLPRIARSNSPRCIAHCLDLVNRSNATTSSTPSTPSAVRPASVFDTNAEPRSAYSVFPWPGTSRQPTANVRETRKIRRSHSKAEGRKNHELKRGFRLSCGSEAGSTLCDLGHLPEHVSRRTQPRRGGAGIWGNYVERHAVTAYLRFLTTEGDDSLAAVADRLRVARTAPTEFTRDCRGSRAIPPIVRLS